jgi:hypothetical protein
MFHQISFTVGLKKDEQCWEDGYLNAGTVGSLNHMTLKIGKKGDVAISSYRLKNGIEENLQKTLNRDDFIGQFSEVFKMDPAAFSEIVQMSAYQAEAEDNLSDEGTLIMRRGEDYCGEINVSDLPKITAKVLKNIRICFMQTEKTLGSGDYIADEEIAAVFLPI